MKTQTICSTSSSAANVNTDGEGNAPHNETSIAVNPTNSLPVPTFRSLTNQEYITAWGNRNALVT